MVSLLQLVRRLSGTDTIPAEQCVRKDTNYCLFTQKYVGCVVHRMWFWTLHESLFHVGEQNFRFGQSKLISVERLPNVPKSASVTCTKKSQKTVTLRGSISSQSRGSCVSDYYRCWFNTWYGNLLRYVSGLNVIHAFTISQDECTLQTGVFFHECVCVCLYVLSQWG